MNTLLICMYIHIYAYIYNVFLIAWPETIIRFIFSNTFLDVMATSPYVFFYYFTRTIFCSSKKQTSFPNLSSFPRKSYTQINTFLCLVILDRKWFFFFSILLFLIKEFYSFIEIDHFPSNLTRDGNRFLCECLILLYCPLANTFPFVF